MSLLSVEALTLRFKDGVGDKTILDNVNLSFDKDEIVVLSGPSGCGKSSLLYALALLRKPSEGIIKYKDTIVNDRKQMENIRYNDYGFVFQQHYLISYLSVLENVTIKSHTSKEAAIQILDKVGMADHINKKVYQLSGGQKQRVAIARAIVDNPTIIFADEPTASLDRENAIQIYNLLRDVAKDKLLIMATHDKSLLCGNEKIYTFSNNNVTVQNQA